MPLHSGRTVSPFRAPSARRTLLVATTVLVAACAVPPPGAAPSSGAGVQQAAVGDLRIAANKQALDAQLRAKGWIPVGTSGAGTTVEPTAHYLSVTNNSVYQKVGEATFRLTQLIVFPTSAASTLGAAAAVLQNEYSCNDRTVRTVASRSYADRGLVTPATKSVPFPTQARPVSANDVSNAPYKALCERSGSGSALLVGNERALSNAHVVAGCRKLEAVARGQRYPAKVLAQDPRVDLALVEVTGYTSAAVSGLGLRRSLNTGEAVTVAGFPLAGLLGSDLNVQTGIVNALTGTADNLSQFQMSATVQPGNSGGPVFDRSGQVAGIVVQKGSSLLALQANATNINVGIKPEILRLFLSANYVPLLEVDAGARIDTEDVARRARELTLKLECSMGVAS